MKRFFSFFSCSFLMIVLMLFCSSCKSDIKEEGKNSSEQVNEGEMILYYVTSDWSYLSPHTVSFDQLISAENLIDSVVTDLLEGCDDEGAVAPIPHGMTYQRYTYDGKGTVSVFFSVDWESVASYDIVLSKSAFVRTLCQMDGVKSVTYEMTDIIDDKKIVRDELTPESFSDMNRILDSEMETDIYMPDISGENLERRRVTLDCSSEKSIEEQIIYALNGDYDGCQSPFNSKTALKSIVVDGGTCYITFNSCFAEGKDGVDNTIAVYSIIDSFAGLDNVSNVRIIIDDAPDSIGDIDLAKKFVGDYSYLNR